MKFSSIIERAMWESNYGICHICRRTSEQEGHVIFACGECHEKAKLLEDFLKIVREPKIHHFINE